MSTIDTAWKLDSPIHLGWHRLGGLLGIAMLVLIFTGAAIGDPNDTAADLNPDQSSAVIASRLVDQHDAILKGATIQAFGVLALIGFVAWIAAWLRPRGETDQWVTYAILGGGFLAAAMVLVYIALGIGAVQIASYGGETVIARMFAALMWEWSRVMAVSFAMLAGATSVGLLRATGRLPMLGLAGLIVAAAALVPATAWIGLMAIFLWLGVLAVVMLVIPRGVGQGAMAMPRDA